MPAAVISATNEVISAGDGTPDKNGMPYTGTHLATVNKEPVNTLTSKHIFVHA